MAQNIQLCPVTLSICAIRVTALHEDGSVAGGANNAYVTNQMLSLGISPDIEEGDEKVLLNGCGAILARAKNPSLFKGTTLALTKGALEPALESLLTGGGLLLDSSDTPVPVGYSWPVQTNADSEGPPAVAVEAWVKNRTGNRQSSAPFAFTRYVWPFTRWQWGDSTLEDDFQQPTLNGTTEGNSLWGDGPYGDSPFGALDENGGYHYDNSIPEAQCGFVGVASS